jgi:aspartyl-tRNA(Asn)/glutamyl-tRNA(Gln) amidotransferase subunit A
MSQDEIAWMTAVDMAEAVRSRALSPVEITEAVLARIERFEPVVNAFAHLDAEGARAQAKQAEAAVMRGDTLGALHGVPVTIKDLFVTSRMPTQFGSNLFRGNQPALDNPSVTRAMAAGAIVLGKTTTSEFGWTGVSRSPLTGITHNPWRRGYNAGASSAGAGAAAAAGFGPLHQGSDGAGSIRMPAHFCGIYGLKPTFGRVPYHPVGVGDYTSHIGPMTRSVADAALLLAVMSGPDPLDHTTLETGWAAPSLEGAVAAMRGLRIAYSPDLGFARVDAEVAALVAQAVARFAAMGAIVEQVATPWAADGPALSRLMWNGHFSRLLPKLATHRAVMDPGLVASIEAGSQVTLSAYQLARERKYAYVAAQQQWFQDWDLLLTPAVSVAAFPADRLMPEDWPQHPWDWAMWAEFSYPFNFSGAPAASIPCGFTASGLPVGLQIAGRRFDDAGVLRASAAFEAVAPWRQHRPALTAAPG